MSAIQTLVSRREFITYALHWLLFLLIANSYLLLQQALEQGFAEMGLFEGSEGFCFIAQ